MKMFTARWRSLDEDRRSGILCLLLAIAVVGTLYGTVYGTYAIWKHNGRTQAVERAKKMDGETYTIRTIGWNWVGDTRLYLNNERGEDAGWIMIHMNNPLTANVNPLFLNFSSKRYDPLPFPMKIRARFRQEAWSDPNVSSQKEEYTGSFLDFEQLKAESTERASGKNVTSQTSGGFNQ